MGLKGKSGQRNIMTLMEKYEQDGLGQVKLLVFFSC